MPESCVRLPLGTRSQLTTAAREGDGKNQERAYLRIAGHTTARRRPRGIDVGLVLFASAVVTVTSGCCQPPRSRDDALLRINQNLAQIDEVLDYKGLVSFRFRDAEDRVQRIPPTDARVFFHPDRELQFNVRHGLAGTVAQFGSNAARYWLWIDYEETRRLWHGAWARIAAGYASTLAIPPNELLDALMLRPLATVPDHCTPARLEKRGLHYWLVYDRLASNGEVVGTRAIRLKNLEPCQPCEVIDRLADGRVVLRAKLSHYRRVGPDGPYTARAYVVTWPLDDAQLRFDVHAAKFRPDLTELREDLFEFPAGWQGEVEGLDTASPPEPSTGS